MKYIPLVALSAFLFACSQESSTGTEVGSAEEQLQNGSTALVEEATDSEGDFALTKKSYFNTSYPATRVVSQFPTRMTIETKVTTTKKPNNKLDRDASSIAYTEVYDSKIGDLVYYDMKRNGIILFFDKTKLRRQNNHLQLPISQASYKFARDTAYTSYKAFSREVQSVKLADLAIVAAYTFYHGKDTVYATAGTNISNALADSVYRDILLPRL